MPPLGTQYEKVTPTKTDDYTIDASDDVVVFEVATAKTATLPLAKLCTEAGNREKKIIASTSGSADVLTIAVQSGNTLVGENALNAGETAFVTSNGVSVWYSQGGSGVSGVSGFSGFSGHSAYSGFSGGSAYSGYSGRSAYSGVSGFSGYSGISGYCGVSGFSGYSGFSGFSGYSGYSGYSGI